jgi:hypothetical protein
MVASTKTKMKSPFSSTLRLLPLLLALLAPAASGAEQTARSALEKAARGTVHTGVTFDGSSNATPRGTLDTRVNASTATAPSAVKPAPKPTPPPPPAPKPKSK